jgi:peptidoglycan/LPS O-acetylase OafA/YrhL
LVEFALNFIGYKTGMPVIKILHNYLQLFFITRYLLFFTFGIFFYTLFKKRRITISQVLIIAVFILLQAIFLQNPYEVIIFLLFICLFFIFLFKESWLMFLKNPIIAKIGLISYPLYLIHQEVGGLIIKKIGDFFSWSNFSASVFILFPILFVLLIFSFIVDNYIGNPLNLYFKKLIRK